jgi:hypothetical protein
METVSFTYRLSRDWSLNLTGEVSGPLTMFSKGSKIKDPVFTTFSDHESLTAQFAWTDDFSFGAGIDHKLDQLQYNFLPGSPSQTSKVKIDAVGATVFANYSF